MSEKLTVKAGDVVLIRGCNWSAGWEFDAPWIIYEPVQRYGFTGSLGAEAMQEPFEDLVVDLCVEPEGVERKFSASSQKEFAIRGWNSRRFPYRRSAFHAEQKVRFYVDEKTGELEAETGPIREIPARESEAAK